MNFKLSKDYRPSTLFRRPRVADLNFAIAAFNRGV